MIQILQFRISKLGGSDVAKLLKSNGYQTAIIGKWHLKKEPSGFDYYNILHDQGRYWDPILRTADNFHKDFEEWDVHKRINLPC